MSAEKNRAAIKADAPQMFDLMEMLKNEFDAKVLYVKTKSIEAGVEPNGGVQPHRWAPASTWPYAVGQSPRKR